ncbi:MAG: Gfo/Idh/MocA family oxidoreductase, partial [Geminicoccaceae bacterium]
LRGERGGYAADEGASKDGPTPGDRTCSLSRGFGPHSDRGHRRYHAWRQRCAGGSGWWGKHIATRLVGHPFLHVAGIGEPTEANHAAIGEMGLPIWTDLAEPLTSADIDAVILTTPNPLHEE